MLKEFIEHIQETTSPKIQEINGENYYISANGIEQVRPKIDSISTLLLNSLEALIKMIQTEGINQNSVAPLYVTVPDHETVQCFTHPCKDLRYSREVYYKTIATDVPGWESHAEMGFEEAQIAMRTRFQETQDIPYLQKLLSEITTGAKVTLNDNGIATSIVTQKGVALQTNEAIKPIVNLRPYRTFQEVEQPESPFLIRVNERKIAFIEADGGMWKLQARKTIKAFLEKELKKEIEKQNVVVAL